ncbi:MAG: Na+/H+ antiporter NhaA [Deltaproteobacteria bacterium]|nr:Na+/H+ antiporter NhaA [Deltaproteobacteria bacterium]
MSERPAPRLLERAGAPLQRFLELEAASTILLLAATGVALVWANSPWAPLYEALLHVPLALRIGPWELALGFEHFVNDALMAVFFFVVGLEIKRELAVGELSSASRALLPVVAAAGGMVVPAGLYAAFHWDGPALRGWGIPMATDIAFAVAALSVFGARVAPGLKVFLLALAIADDIGAVAVIALFYTESLSMAWLGAAAAGLALVAGLGRAGVRAYGVYLAAGIGVWLAVHASGVHATIAAVALGFLTPARPLDPPAERRGFVRRAVALLERGGDLLEGEGDPDGHRRHDLARQVSRAARASLSPLDELVQRLHPVVAFVIMPVFALANAGVPIELAKLAEPLPLRVAIGVALGLVAGKPAGITLFAWLAVRLGVAELPRGVGWLQVVATGCLAGIGFTVALFVAALAFEAPELKAGAKVGILVGSAAATALGVALLARALPRQVNCGR